MVRVALFCGVIVWWFIVCCCVLVIVNLVVLVVFVCVVLWVVCVGFRLAACFILIYLITVCG